MDYELEGKTVVVTGAAQGIGAEITTSLLNQGAYVIAIDLKNLNDSELEDKIEVSNHNTRFLNLNYQRGDASDVDRMKQVFDSYYGDNTISLDGLVNNVGLLGLDPERNLEQWDRHMNAHAKTAYVMTEVCYPLMRKGGSIVNMGSIELEMCAKNAVLYTAGKGAVLGLTIGYAVTLADKGIRVNMVSPGNVNTNTNVKQYQDDPKTKEVIDKFEFRTPMKRSVEPKEVANEVLFLLSNLSSGTTGQNRIVDCGYTKALWDNAWIKE
ncbi:SDR family oxidoreductase [Candidatus Woesearchaeota archaeon]|nr:hypothetical protein [uncultured archaeon]AQS32251.1 hypothetical protein [uncultured archaeon]MBS3149369.1 SDR family oxidoreductase [Candidatus Woesearchaeota archaeon]